MCSTKTANASMWQPSLRIRKNSSISLWARYQSINSTACSWGVHTAVAQQPLDDRLGIDRQGDLLGHHTAHQ